MIIYHHKNMSAFKGNHTVYWLFQPVIQSLRFSVTSEAAPVTFKPVWAININNVIGEV